MSTDKLVAVASQASTPEVSLSHVLDRINPRSGLAAARLLGLRVVVGLERRASATKERPWPGNVCSLRLEDGALVMRQAAVARLDLAKLEAAVSAELERVLRPLALEEGTGPASAAG